MDIISSIISSAIGTISGSLWKERKQKEEIKKECEEVLSWKHYGNGFFIRENNIIHEGVIFSELVICLPGKPVVWNIDPINDIQNPCEHEKKYSLNTFFNPDQIKEQMKKLRDIGMLEFIGRYYEFTEDK